MAYEEYRNNGDPEVVVDVDVVQGREPAVTISKSPSTVIFRDRISHNRFRFCTAPSSQ